MLISTLALGLLIGMQHAFEADHIAAVSALVSRRRGWRTITRHGAIWGLGHTGALLVLSAAVVFTPWSMSEHFHQVLELVVGLMLIGLGTHVLYRLWRDRVHVHPHQHDDGSLHLHAHSHRDDPQPHESSRHEHRHHGRSLRTLLVGLTHGAAGSAALVVFVATSLETKTASLLYVLLFGVGSILGMVFLSAVIALPLTVAARRTTWAHRTLQIVVGGASILIGLRLVGMQVSSLAE